MSALQKEQNKKTRVCDLCGLPSTVKCGGCVEARYCSSVCQKAHWADHKLLCQQIQAERKERERRERLIREEQDKMAVRQRELGEALYNASLDGMLSEVRALLALGADPRYKWDDVDAGLLKGFTPLHAASSKGHVEVMQVLLDAGANPNQLGGAHALSSLYQAASQNQTRAIALLVRSGGNVNLANSQGSTPLGIAVQNGRKEAVVALLVAKAAVNQAANDGRSPIYAAAQNGNVEILKLLIKAGGDTNQLMNGFSPLIAAIGHVECVKILLAAGADALFKDGQGHTALDWAIHFKHTAAETVLRAHLAA